MSEPYRICFLGDTQVGKTTFLAALYRTRAEHIHFEACFDDELKSGSLLDSYAESIISGSKAPSTTSVRRFRGSIVWRRDERLSIEFIDIPGELFHQGYMRSDGELLEQMRPFINECDYIYYFFDQQLMQSSDTLFVPLIHLLQDYYQQRAQQAALCLVLTKLDESPDYMGDEGGARLLDELEQQYSHELACMRRYATLHLSRVSSYGQPDGALGLASDAFLDLFSPLRDLAQSKRRSTRLLYLFIVSALVGVAVWLLLLLDESEQQMVHAQGISQTGWHETYENREIYVRDQLSKLALEPLTDESVPRLRAEYDALIAKQPDFRARILEQWVQSTEAYRASLDARLLDIITQLRSLQSKEKWDEYEQLVEVYQCSLSSSLPDTLTVTYEQIFGKEKIDGILAHNYRGNPYEYTRARKQAIRAYINTEPKCLSARQRVEVERALQLTSDFLSDRRYSVEIESKGLSSSYDFYYKLQIGNDANPEDVNSSKVYQNSMSARSTRMSFRWSIAHRVKVTLLHQTFFYGDDDDLLADIWRDSSMSAVSLSLFASTEWQQKSYAFQSNASHVRFRFKLWDDQGKPISAEDFELVVTYVLSNEFWQQLRETL